MFEKTSVNKLGRNEFVMKISEAVKEAHSKFEDQSKATKTCCVDRTLRSPALM